MHIYLIDRFQEINQLLEYCIHDVLQLPLVTPDHVIDNAVTCDVCRTTRETLRLEAAHMIRSLEQTLERGNFFLFFHISFHRKGKREKGRFSFQLTFSCNIYSYSISCIDYNVLIKFKYSFWGFEPNVLGVETVLQQ